MSAFGSLPLQLHGPIYRHPVLIEARDHDHREHDRK